MLADDAKINPLNLTRLEVANVILISRQDLFPHELVAAAVIINESIHRQFPFSDNKERVYLARKLAEDLKDPKPYKIAGSMRAFYYMEERANAIAEDDNAGDDADGMPELSLPNAKLPISR